MNWKRKGLWLGSALMLGLSFTGPAMATDIGSVPVSVTVSDNGSGMSAGLTSASNANFGTVPVNAAGATGTGLVDAGTVTLGVQYSNDTKLYRPGSYVNIKLGDGSVANAYLAPGAITPFLGSDQVNFQIPGRYLSITEMNNPQQAKYTGGPSSTGNIWANDGNVGRVPRGAGSATTGIAIYKVGDIAGTFGSNTSGCSVTTGSSLAPWPSACGSNNFGESGASHQVAEIYPGSGFVSAEHTIQLGLNVPAGAYPTTYTGTLTVEQVAA